MQQVMSHLWKLMGERPGTYWGAFNQSYSFYSDAIKCMICFLKIWPSVCALPRAATQALKCSVLLENSAYSQTEGDRNEAALPLSQCSLLGVCVLCWCLCLGLKFQKLPLNYESQIGFPDVHWKEFVAMCLSKKWWAALYHFHPNHTKYKKAIEGSPGKPSSYIWYSRRGERYREQTSPALLPVPFLLIADVHQLPYYPSLFPKPQRVLSCGPSSRVTAVCCFWTAQYYCLAQVLVSDSEVVAGKCEPCPKLSHEGLACSQRKIGSAWWSMSSSLSGRNKKWFSLFLFHPAVLQLRSQWSEAVLFVFERCSFLTRVIFFVCCLFVVSFCVWGCIACFEASH